MISKSILVVDDDPKVRALLRRCLEEGGYSVREASDSDGVRDAFSKSIPDLMTLDLNLGADDGLDIARDIRRSHNVPIIMVTGKDDVIDRIVGLEVGADDYLPKPFHVREVLARVRSVLRRSDGQVPSHLTHEPGASSSTAPLNLDGLTVDLDHMILKDRDGKICDLTTADFKLLVAFLNHPKRPLSRDRLMDLIDGPQWAPLDRTIDNQVARLRKKIERDPATPLLIKTVRGIGYTLTETPTTKS
ncbi:response regulator [Falsihalocynthiibacter arcticus]|uniref:Two-component system response regulator n=1 Tax=Falsihalocynthiibacter arcticus TaxID=1579316 RepID=A0A126V0X4_9RHOB|nr:response regulator [Falsihalocynthiibacter arcticus]AML51506.1 two-component system response regulator [Falsihalocynthiibacter arcticus]